jgi:hypothetical protein
VIPWCNITFMTAIQERNDQKRWCQSRCHSRGPTRSRNPWTKPRPGFAAPSLTMESVWSCVIHFHPSAGSKVVHLLRAVLLLAAPLASSSYTCDMMRAPDGKSTFPPDCSKHTFGQVFRSSNPEIIPATANHHLLDIPGHTPAKQPITGKRLGSLGLHW